MNVVVDTNVLVSGLLTPSGPCGQIVGLLSEGLLLPCVDARILQEYERVLPRPLFQIDVEDVLAILELVRSNAEVVEPMPLPVELPHASDVPFLEVAAHTAAILVAGNTRHFPGKARAGVTVASPKEFLELLRHSS